MFEVKKQRRNIYLSIQHLTCGGFMSATVVDNTVPTVVCTVTVVEMGSGLTGSE